MIKTVLFDLDGTLLPMDLEIFVNSYIKQLAVAMAPLGYNPDLLAKSIWIGTERMVKNDGNYTNEAVFWKAFSEIFGAEAIKDLPVFEDFYRNGFQAVASDCGFDGRAAETVYALREMGIRTVLATNPVFPSVATESRVRWAGLQPEDFEYITTYENSHFCKPNPAYFREILEKLELKPAECLMVGNDAQEDLAAAEAGIPVFLLTDCLIDRNNTDLTSIPHGSFPELLAYLSENWN